MTRILNVRTLFVLMITALMTLQSSFAEEPRESQIKKSALYYNALSDHGWRNPDSVKIMESLIKENRNWNKVFQVHGPNENVEGDYTPIWWTDKSSPSIRASAELALAFLICQSTVPDVSRIQKLAQDIFKNCPKGLTASSPEFRQDPAVLASYPELQENDPERYIIGLVSVNPRIAILSFLAGAQQTRGLKSQAIDTNERIILNYPDEVSCLSESDVCWEYSCEAIQRIREMGSASALPALKRLLPKIKTKSAAHNCAMFAIAEIYDTDLQEKVKALREYRAFLRIFPGLGAECCSSTAGHGSQAKMRIEKLEQELQKP